MCRANDQCLNPHNSIDQLTWSSCNGLHRLHILVGLMTSWSPTDTPWVVGPSLITCTFHGLSWALPWPAVFLATMPDPCLGIPTQHHKNTAKNPCNGGNNFSGINRQIYEVDKMSLAPLSILRSLKFGSLPYAFRSYIKPSLFSVRKYARCHQGIIQDDTIFR